jgi:hypothetical protein
MSRRMGDWRKDTQNRSFGPPILEPFIGSSFQYWRTDDRRTCVHITETNGMHLFLYGMQNRTVGPYFFATNRIVISVLAGDCRLSGCAIWLSVSMNRPGGGSVGVSAKGILGLHPSLSAATRLVLDRHSGTIGLLVSDGHGKFAACRPLLIHAEAIRSPSRWRVGCARSVDRLGREVSLARPRGCAHMLRERANRGTPFRSSHVGLCWGIPVVEGQDEACGTTLYGNSEE